MEIVSQDPLALFRAFETEFGQMHKTWNEIDCNLDGRLIGTTKEIVEPRRAVLSTALQYLAPKVSLMARFFENIASEGANLKQAIELVTKQLTEKSNKLEENIKFSDSLQQMLGGHVNGDHQDPHISIAFNTIFDLSTKGEGWKVTRGNPEKLEESMKKKMVTVGVLGAYDAGKTHLCNLLGNKNLRSGHQHRTEGIEVVYPEEKDVHYGLIDVPGSQEAHPINDQNLIAKLPTRSNQTSGEEVKDKEVEKANNNYLERYTLLHSDAKLIHSLKEKFIIENADVVVLVTNKLSESDQEMIYKNVNYYRQWIENSKKGAASQKYLYIVHNFKMHSKREAVEKQIEKDIQMCFEVEETPIFAADKEEGCNNFMYRDQFGVCHLVLAAQGSEAGEYYNTTTIKYLKSRINNTDIKATLNLVESFKTFCNANLPKMIGQEIELGFNEKETALVNKKGNDIKIDGIAWTSLGEVVTSDFKPKFSILNKKLSNGDQQLEVEVESIDCERAKAPKANSSHMLAKVENKDGYYCLKLKGEKVVDRGATDAQDPDTKTELVNYSRGEGPFNITINLVKNKTLKARDVTETKPGITKFTFVFTDDEGDVYM